MFNPLFQHMNENEIQACLQELHAYSQRYEKNTILLLAGDSNNQIGIVQKGSVTIESYDLWGNTTILNHIEKQGLFAESYALLEGSVMMVNVRANEDCEVLYLNMENIRSIPETSWKTKLLFNLLQITSKKNIQLSQRSFYIAHKSIRQRVFSYLTTISIQKQTNDFEIPLNRQQLADYLNVERTALSKELAKMEKEGILSFRKNHFILKEKAGV